MARGSRTASLGKIDASSSVCEAISIAETSGCTRGSAITHNNCFGIMTWETGQREFKRYNTTEESFRDCERIWSAYYGGRIPTIEDAKVWTGQDRYQNWYNIVTSYLNKNV